MRGLLPLTAAAILAAAACLRASPATKDGGGAREDFLAGVEAALNRDDDAAAGAWARCLTKAVKGSQEESDCRLFAGMLRERLAQNAPEPDESGEARKAYVEGRDAYLHGDYPRADRRWHECLTAADGDPASRPDCLMALELIAARRRSAAVEKKAPAAARAPGPSEAAKASQSYLEGVIYYQKGDYLTARERWNSCAAVNSDCRAGLEKLDELFSPSAPAAPTEAARAADQIYLEGVVFYQKGDYEKAHERWLACGERDANCRAGLERLEKLYGFPAAGK